MIDPASVVAVIPNNKEQVLNLGNIPDCDYETYNIWDDKDFKALILDIKREVRKSFEYQRFIRYIKEYMNMHECAFLEDIENDGTTHIRIEQHHYPFTLHDICIIVFNKRLYYKESLDLEMIAREVMCLHYKLMVGLIPLSETVHQLVHNKYIFIPIDKVLGRYQLFVDTYKEFMLPEHIDVLKRIEEYSLDVANSALNNNVLQQSKIFLEANGAYKLPDLSSVTDTMCKRIQTIKENGYRLPCLTDPVIENKVDNRQKRNAIYFF